MDSARCVAASGLLGFSRRIGLGEFARFPYRHGSWLGRLMRLHGYRPERLLKRLAPHLARPDNRIAGLHLYTFNEIERAEGWRHEIARLAGHDLWWKPSAWMALADQCGVGARPSRRDADRYDHKAPVDRMGCVAAIHLPPVLTVRPHHGRRRAAAGHDAEAERVG